MLPTAEQLLFASVQFPPAIFSHSNLDIKVTNQSDLRVKATGGALRPLLSMTVLQFLGYPSTKAMLLRYTFYEGLRPCLTAGDIPLLFFRRENIR